MAVEPLLRQTPARVAVSLGLLAGAFSALVLGFVSLVWLPHPVAFLAVLVAAGGAVPVGAVPVCRGRWSAGRSGALEQIALAVVVVLLLSGAVLSTTQAIEEHRIRDLGVPTRSDSDFWLVVLGGALIGLSALLAAAPRCLNQRTVAILALIPAVVGVGAVALGVDVRRSTTCADDHVTRQSWDTARSGQRGGVYSDVERIADAIVDCRLLDGSTRAQVRRALGPPDGTGRVQWTWSAGLANDLLGPGDGQELVVRFGGDERVSRSELG